MNSFNRKAEPFLIACSFIIFLLIVCSPSVFSSKLPLMNHLTLDDLSQLQWKKRIVVIYAKSQYKDILSALEDQKSDLSDRDIVWLVVTDNQIYSNYIGELAESLRDTLRIFLSIEEEDMHPKVFLIGKDGGIKDRSHILDFKSLYALIDSMPMRRSEMKKSNK